MFCLGLVPYRTTTAITSLPLGYSLCSLCISIQTSEHIWWYLSGRDEIHHCSAKCMKRAAGSVCTHFTLSALHTSTGLANRTLNAFLFSSAQCSVCVRKWVPNERDSQTLQKLCEKSFISQGWYELAHRGCFQPCRPLLVWANGGATLHTILSLLDLLDFYWLTGFQLIRLEWLLSIKNH